MSTSILDLMDGELRTVVAGGIQRAIKEQPAWSTPASGSWTASERRCTMTVRPLAHPRTGAALFLVSFGDAARSSISRREASVSAERPSTRCRTSA
jgi:hypothetical protein